RLRTLGIAPVSALDPRVRTAMAAPQATPASQAAVSHAFVRMQAMIQDARSLPRDYARIAGFPPTPDAQGQKESAEWTQAVAKHWKRWRTKPKPWRTARPRNSTAA